MQQLIVEIPVSNMHCCLFSIIKTCHMVVIVTELPNTNPDFDIVFGDIGPSDVRITDVPKIEKLNNIKINVHVWEGESSI